jgi:MFS family permease
MANTGIGLAPVDSDAIAQAVIAIAEQRSAGSGGPSGLLIDLFLVSLCLLTLLLGALALRRSTRWANVRRNRARWRIVLTQLPCLMPVVLLVFYPYVVGVVAGGRDVNWIQSLYLSALLFMFVAVWAMTSGAVITARVAALRRTSATELDQ